jgi:hypothetical protein
LYGQESRLRHTSISRGNHTCDRDRRVVEVMGRVDAILGTCGHVVPLEARR